MLVEINLLPQKQPKNYTFLILILGLLLIFAAAGSYIYWQWSSKNNELHTIEQSIENQRLQSEAEQQRLASASSTNSVQKLEDTIHWAENYQVKTVPLLRHLISLLPERGYIYNVKFDSAGKVNLVTQFDTSRESANYMSELTSSKWLDNVKLLTLSTTLGRFNVLTGESAETMERDKSKLDNDPYIPRYTAVFEFTVNQKEAKKAASQQEKKDRAEQKENGGKSG